MQFNNRDKVVKSVQTKLGLVADGVDGPTTWNAIDANLKTTLADIVPIGSLPSITTISDAAYNLIIKYEVGGGESYYNSALKHPEYPGGESGVTIGIGYDLGYTTLAQFTSDWKSYLIPEIFALLSQHLGKKGDAAKSIIHTLNNVVIPWSVAEMVFKNCDIPRYIKETITAFPGCNKLKPDCFGALVSLVFNRGGSMNGDSRREMLNIRNAILGVISTDNIYTYISSQFLSMKRLWNGKGLDGLLVRRDEEATLIKNCQ